MKKVKEEMNKQGVQDFCKGVGLIFDLTAKARGIWKQKRYWYFKLDIFLLAGFVLS